MSSDYLESTLSLVGIPIAYRKFKIYKGAPAPSPPYIIYDIERETASGADDKNLICKKSVFLELYSVEKDRENEAKIEKAINGHDWEKYEDFLESENLYVVSYEFKIIEKIRR